MQLGADPDDLSGLARSLRDAAGRLDSLSSGLARRVRHTPWSGEDARSVQRRWQSEHRPQLVRCAVGLRRLATDLDRHREQQELASRSAPGTPGPHGAPAQPLRGPTTGTLAQLPIVEDRYRGTLEGRVGPLSGTLTGELTLARMENDRVRVTLTQAAGAGGVLSAGASVDVAVGGPHGPHGAASGTAADAAARVGALHRRVWEVDADRVPDLLGRLAVEQTALAATRHPQPQVGLAALADDVVERLSGHDPGWDTAVALATAVPTPHSTESLVEVELAAGAAAGLGSVFGIGARAQGAQAVRVGRLDAHGRPGAVLESEGAATAALTSTLLRRAGVTLPTDAHRATWVRLVLTPADGALPAHLDVRVRLTEDTTVHDTVVRLHPRAGIDQAALGAAAQHLVQGDPAAALDRLQQLQVDAGRVELRTGDGRLSGHSARAAGGGGVGLGGGVSVRGQVVRVDRR